MHEFRRYIEDELSARGWKQADLVRASGLSRSHVSKLLRDDRPRLGQMPDAATLDAVSRAFDVPLAVVQTAAARALDGYVGDRTPLQVDLRRVPTAVLLRELERRSASVEDLLVRLLGDTATAAMSHVEAASADFAWCPGVAVELEALEGTCGQYLATPTVLNEDDPRSPGIAEPRQGARVASLLASGRREWESETRAGQRQRT